MTDSDVLALAQRALDLVGADPREALREADEVFSVTPAPGVARGGLGPRSARRRSRSRRWATCDSAETRLRAGVRSTAGRSDRAEAEARMSLAFILLERGRSRAALAQADGRRVPVGVPRARDCSVNGPWCCSAAVTSGALAAYGKALPVLRRAGDDVWESTLLNNRGLLHAYRGSLVQARRTSQRARAPDGAGGPAPGRAGVDWNLGFVAAMDGDVPEALARYDRAEDYYERREPALGGMLVDRGLVLLPRGAPR